MDSFQYKQICRTKTKHKGARAKCDIFVKVKNIFFYRD